MGQKVPPATGREGQAVPRPELAPWTGAMAAFHEVPTVCLAQGSVHFPKEMLCGQQAGHTQGKAPGQAALLGYPQDLNRQRLPSTSLWVCSPPGRGCCSQVAHLLSPPAWEGAGGRHVSGPGALSTRGAERRTEGP